MSNDEKFKSQENINSIKLIFRFVGTIVLQFY